MREITIPTPEVIRYFDFKLWEIRKDTLAVYCMRNVFIYDLNTNTSRMLQLNLDKNSSLSTKVIFLKNFILQM